METPSQDGRDTQGDGVYATSLGLDASCGGLGCPSKVILDTGASANLVGAGWLNNHNSILKALGRPPAKIMPAFARSRYGDGRVGDVRRAASIPIAIAGATGHFMANVVDADVPALLGKEASETLGGHLNFCERVLTLASLGADVPLEMIPAGRYLLNVVDFPESTGASMSDARNGGNAKSVANERRKVRKNAFFFTDVVRLARVVLPSPCRIWR